MISYAICSYETMDLASLRSRDGARPVLPDQDRNHQARCAVMSSTDRIRDELHPGMRLR